MNRRFGILEDQCILLYLALQGSLDDDVTATQNRALYEARAHVRLALENLRAAERIETDFLEKKHAKGKKNT